MNTIIIKPTDKLKNGQNIIQHKDRVEVVTYFDHIEAPSLTQQQFKDDCDVNLIMSKFIKTGEITHLNRQQGVYADLTELGDYQDMVHRVQHADNIFETLPPKVREKFSHNPAQLIDWLANPNNLEESYNLGLREKPRTDPILTELQLLNKNLADQKKGAP